MKTFEIGFKLVYGETSEWGLALIRAVTKSEALKRFAKRKRVKDCRVTRRSLWRWNEGVWSASFRYI